MTIKLFEEPDEAAEFSEQLPVSIATRLIYCVLASITAVVPALAAAYGAYCVANVFRGMRDAESARAARVFIQLHLCNTPLVLALGFSALLAFAIALVLAVDPKRRVASVGLPFSIGVPLIAAIPGVFLWYAETTVMAVLSGKSFDTPIAILARNVSFVLLCVMILGVLAVGATFVCSVVSLCLPAHSRTEALAQRRAFVWVVTGTLLLAFAGAYFIVV